MLKFAFLLSFFCLAGKTFAGRPLITDDAGILDKNQIQLETWLYSDERSLQHWVVPTFAVTDFFEVSASGVQGLALVQEQQNIYSVSGPILQGKVQLLKPQADGTPGLAVSAGSLAPFGRGYFKSPAWEYFLYLAGSSYVAGNDKVLLHANLGRQTQRQLNSSAHLLLWGLAAEVKTNEKTYCFVEASNGELFAVRPGVATQVGFRHDLKANFQIDGSLGTGVSGSPRLPFWATVGLRYVSDFLVK